ncbi:hypothetical protein [Streptomyces sp. NPDC058108]|uniref:hypothetical protein n=1 Tax=Streptomyces sp. NPDC058108 TaxID=3346344 RepID=UPI0036E63A80
MTTDHTVQQLTADQLDDIEARAAAATPGPWSSHEDWPGRVFSDGGPNYLHIARTTGWNAEANERFIAHAREDVDALLAEVRRLRTELTAAARRDVTLPLAVIAKHGDMSETVRQEINDLLADAAPRPGAV